MVTHLDLSSDQANLQRGTTQVREKLLSLDAQNSNYAAAFVESLLSAACQQRVSDIHLQPTTGQLNVRWRIDGVLQNLGNFPLGSTADVIARLKVLAQLLTYRTEVPQEGRLTLESTKLEMRVSTFPTIHGERAVVRVFAAAEDLQQLDQLGLPSQICTKLDHFLQETTGAILITGPAGSGKTTTAYACLRRLAKSTGGARNLVSLEDPVEVAVAGVAQSQVNNAQEFDIHTGLRSLLRQDPEVILVGEMRDRETASIAFQAALTGQLMLTTFHSGSAAEALSRLVDMGIEPYVLRSGILVIVHQRLVRALCSCAQWSTHVDDILGLPVTKTKIPTGCDQCAHTGYAGRTLILEMLCPRELPAVRALLSRDEVDAIEQAAVAGGMRSRWSVAIDNVQEGITSAAEIRRVFGFATPVLSDSGQSKKADDNCQPNTDIEVDKHE